MTDPVRVAERLREPFSKIPIEDVRLLADAYLAQAEELRELREALGRAADQFAQTASALDALGHHVFAVAMRIAEEATRRALSTPEAEPPPPIHFDPYHPAPEAEEKPDG